MRLRRGGKLQPRARVRTLADRFDFAQCIGQVFGGETSKLVDGDVFVLVRPQEMPREFRGASALVALEWQVAFRFSEAVRAVMGQLVRRCGFGAVRRCSDLPFSQILRDPERNVTEGSNVSSNATRAAPPG